LFVRRLLQVRKFVHDDHAQDVRCRVLEECRDPDLALGLELPALNPRDGGVRAQRVLHDVQLGFYATLAMGGALFMWRAFRTQTWS
jgi:hypothetical protein